MKIRISDFKGRVPARSDRLLPAPCSTVARNVLLETGEIEPLRAPVEAHNFGTEVKTIYLDGSSWYGWQDYVDVAPGPIAADRLYFTGDGAPKMRITSSVYGLAVPTPGTAPAVTVLGTVNEDIAESILYAYTYVTSLGEESKPSPVSDSILWSPGLAVRVYSLPSAPPTGRLIEKVRIYRSQTSAAGTTDLYLVAEIDAGEVQFDHDLDADPIQEVIPSVDFDAPPSNLKHLTALPNGMMVGASGKTIRFCEPYQPHAWPLKYELSVDYEIVGFAAFGSAVAILTRGTPYMAQGTTPDGMVLERVEQDLPCLSKQGIVDMGNAAIYPSTEGLVMISAGGAQKVTQGLFTRKQWQAMNPASFTAGSYGGQYIFAHAVGASRAIGMIRIENGDMSFSTAALVVTDLMQDARTQNLYVVMETTKAFRWDAGTNLSATWRSKPLHLTSATNFGAILVEGDAPSSGGNLAVRVYADGDLKRTIDISGINRIERLPSGFLAEKWEIEVEANFTIDAISIAETIEELAVE